MKTLTIYNILFIVLVSTSSYGQDFNRQDAKRITKEFTEELKQITSEKVPDESKAEWMEAVEKLDKAKFQRAIRQDMLKKLSGNSDGGPKSNDGISSNDAHQYFEEIKSQFNQTDLRNYTINDQNAQLPYPLCFINDSCED